MAISETKGQGWKVIRITTEPTNIINETVHDCSDSILQITHPAFPLLTLLPSEKISQCTYYVIDIDAFQRSHHHTKTILRPFFQDHLGEPVPEENFWTLWCKGRLTEADTPTIRMSATSSGLSSAHLCQPPFFTGRMPFLPPNQQCQSTEGYLS